MKLWFSAIILITPHTHAEGKAAWRPLHGVRRSSDDSILQIPAGNHTWRVWFSVTSFIHRLGRWYRSTSDLWEGKQGPFHLLHRASLRTNVISAVCTFSLCVCIHKFMCLHRLVYVSVLKICSRMHECLCFACVSGPGDIKPQWPINAAVCLRGRRKGNLNRGLKQICRV